MINVDTVERHVSTERLWEYVRRGGDLEALARKESKAFPHLEQYAEDVKRIHRQYEELVDLRPEREAKWTKDFLDTMDRLEADLKEKAGVSHFEIED